MMISRPVVSSLWIGGPLSYLELLSLKSMIDWGHRVKLYHYEPLQNVPDWLETHDANAIMPMSPERLEEFRNALTIVANLFRYHLLAKTDEIWCDCDVYLLRPLLDQEYIFVEESPNPSVWNNSLLRLPQKSPALLELLELLSTDTPLLPEGPYFLHPSRITSEELEALGGNGNIHISKFPWGTTGPRALSYFIDKHDLGKYGWPRQSHMPINERANVVLARRRGSRGRELPINTHSIHFYGSTLRNRLIKGEHFIDNLPHSGSFIDLRLKDHGIDPADAPLLSAVGKEQHQESLDSVDMNLREVATTG